MMILVALLCAAAAYTLAAIILNFSSLSSIKAFLLSMLVMFICAIALSAKEAALKKGMAPAAKWLIWIVTIAILAPAVKSYLGLWPETHGFWSVTFLGWLTLLALIIVWLPIQAGEGPRSLGNG